MANSEQVIEELLEGPQAANVEDDLEAAIYARTSSSSSKYGYSIDGQVRRCWKRCQQMGWTVTHVFRDEAISGKDRDRPMFQQLLRRAEAGAFDVVVFWKLDRFSRSLLHAVQLEEEFREWGVALHSITEHINTTTPTGRFNFRNISNAAEFERELSKQRSRMAMAELASEHKWPNDHPPLGYRKASDGRLEIVPTEADTVRLIFERYISLRSMPELAEKLNTRGITTKSDNNWTPRGVGDVLRNELYVGNYTVADVDEYVPEYQIIEEELFNRATKVRTRFQRSSASSERDSMSKSRRQQRVMAIVEQFQDYLEQRPSQEN